MKIVLKKEESTLNCYLFYLVFWWEFGVQLQTGLYHFPQIYGVWADIIVSGITIIFIVFMRRNWLVSQLKNLKKKIILDCFSCCSESFCLCPLLKFHVFDEFFPSGK